MYTPSLVVNVLNKLCGIESVLDAGIQQREGIVYVDTPVPASENTEIPLGGSNPYRVTPHAVPPMDGKARARAREELHVMYIDVRAALLRIPEDDANLIRKYHIYKTHTLDDLIKERGTVSRGSMQRRIMRSVYRLTRELERKDLCPSTQDSSASS